jgi:hypothetical protein
MYQHGDRDHNTPTAKTESRFGDNINDFLSLTPFYKTSIISAKESALGYLPTSMLLEIMVSAFSLKDMFLAPKVLDSFKISK